MSLRAVCPRKISRSSGVAVLLIALVSPASPVRHSTRMNGAQDAERVVLTRGQLRATGDAVCGAPNPRRFSRWEDLEGAYATWVKDVAGPVLRDLVAALDAPPPAPPCPDISQHRPPPGQVVKRPRPEAVSQILAGLLAERGRVSISDLARAIQGRVSCSRATAFRAVEEAIAAKAILARFGYLRNTPETEQRETAARG
jgi:hypothetical protein